RARAPHPRAPPGAGRPRSSVRGTPIVLRGGDTPPRRLRRSARHGSGQHHPLRGGREQEDPARAGVRLHFRWIPRGGPERSRGRLQPAGRRALGRAHRGGGGAALPAPRGDPASHRELGPAWGARASRNDRDRATGRGRGRPRAAVARGAYPRLAGRARPRGGGAAPRRDLLGAVVGVTITFNDVTRQREIDRMKTEFVSTVSHELRTPLTSIKGSLHLLLSDPSLQLDATQRQLVDISL